jgi:WD40 repeat protein
VGFNNDINYFFITDAETSKKPKAVDVSSVDYHEKMQLLVTGFDNGVFLIHEMQPDLNLIHSLSISDQSILSVSFNPR